MRYSDEHWVTCDDVGPTGKPLSMSKTQLGLFVYTVLEMGGQIVGSFALGRTPRSFVQLAIKLPYGSKIAFEQKTGVCVEKPPVITGG